MSKRKRQEKPPKAAKKAKPADPKPSKQPSKQPSKSAAKQPPGPTAAAAPGLLDSPSTSQEGTGPSQLTVFKTWPKYFIYKLPNSYSKCAGLILGGHSVNVLEVKG